MPRLTVSAATARRAIVSASLTVTATLALAACSACGKSPAGGASSAGTSGTPVSRTTVAPEAGPAAARDVAMWSSAKSGDVEDLASLATHEGAAGLIEGAAEPELRTTALRAMAYARGWAQLPYLAQAAGGEADEDAKVALDSVVELAARPRRAEDVEDEGELREGCEKLGGLARDVARARERRVLAIRALRMMPCPKQDLPSDLDAK